MEEAAARVAALDEKRAVHVLLRELAELCRQAWVAKRAAAMPRPEEPAVATGDATPR